MTSVKSAAVFHREIADLNRWLGSCLAFNRVPVGYKTIVRTLADRLHTIVVDFGTSNAFEVYEAEHQAAFDALGHLNAAVADWLPSRRHLDQAHDCLSSIDARGGGA